MDSPIAQLQASYDRVADRYAAGFCGELSHKPFDRKMLDRLIEKAPASAPICDLGCGPGQIAAYLNSRGTRACGIDLSAGMVACARRLNPGIPFEQGNMLALTGVPDGSFGGIAAFYSIVHIPHTSVLHALAEMKRVLLPGAVLLLAFHIGQETLHKTNGGANRPQARMKSACSSPSPPSPMRECPRARSGCARQPPPARTTASSRT